MRITIIAFFLLLTFFGLSQKNDVGQLDLSPLVEIAFPSVRIQFHKGMLIISGDTIIDSVRILVKKIQYKAGEKIKSIKTKNITSVRLFDQDTLITKQGFMDFVHLGRYPELLYRRLYKGSFEIYDRTNVCNENPGFIGEDMIILDSGKIFQDISSSMPNKRYLIKYINKRFKKDFHSSDFKHKVDIINWIKINDK